MKVEYGWIPHLLEAPGHGIIQTWSTLWYQLKIPENTASGVHVHINTAQIHFHVWHQTWEFILYMYTGILGIKVVKNFNCVRWKCTAYIVHLKKLVDVTILQLWCIATSSISYELVSTLRFSNSMPSSNFLVVMR